MPLTTRSEPPLPDEALVLRGGMMLARDLALAAERCEAQLGFPGISVFAATDTGSGSSCWPLRRSTAGAVRSLGCELVPTGIAPHVTLHLPGTDFATLARLRDLFGPPIPNPLAR